MSSATLDRRPDVLSAVIGLGDVEASPGAPKSSDAAADVRCGCTQAPVVAWQLCEDG